MWPPPVLATINGGPEIEKGKGEGKGKSFAILKRDQTNEIQIQI
jgi:hypothetical protein